MLQVRKNVERPKDQPKQTQEKHGLQQPKLMRQSLNIQYLLVSNPLIGKGIPEVSFQTALTPQLIMQL